VRPATGRLSSHAQVEIEDNVDIAAGVVGRERGKMVDAEEGTLRGIVHRRIAAGFGDADVFDRAIAIDAKGDSGFGATSDAHGGVDGVLHPILADSANDGLHVPGIASGEVATALATSDGSAVDGAGSIGVAGGNAGGTLFAGDRVVIIERFLFEDYGRAAGAKRLSRLRPLGNFGGAFGFYFWGRGKRVRLVETLGGIDNAAVGGVSGLKHGNASGGSGGDDIDFEAGIAAATDPAPLIAGTLKPDSREHDDGDSEVQEHRIKQRALEGELVGGGDGAGHFRVVSHQ